MICPSIGELPLGPPGSTGWPYTESSPALPVRTPEGDPWPKILIVIPSYNQGKYLEETLRSVLLQGYPNLECIVMDGGSTDNSVDVINKYGAWISEWTSGEDRGQSDAINQGFSNREFTLGSWLNSDDTLCPGSISAVASHLLDHPDCAFLAGDGIFVCEDGKTEIRYQRIAQYTFEDLLGYGKGFYLPQPSVFFSSTLLAKVGGVSEHLHYSMDLDLWLRMRNEMSFCYIPQSLSRMRQHQNSKTIGQNELAMKEVAGVISKHAHGKAKALVASVEHAMNRLRAEKARESALLHFSANRVPQAWAGLVRAVSLHPGIILTRRFIGIFIRLILPKILLNKIFHRHQIFR